MDKKCWIVICPERYVRGGLWHIWYRENCVAVGWPPSAYHAEGATDSSGWKWARECMRRMLPGEAVIPYLQQWRIGPVGTIRAVRLADEEWKPTVPKGAYRLNPDEAEVGRRIEVEWHSEGMPPNGQAALIPSDRRLRRPDALYTIEELRPERFQELVEVLKDSHNWIPLGEPEEVPSEVVQEEVEARPFIILEENLKKLLKQNLGVIELGLSAHPEYPLEEFVTDVGRIDLFCQDRDRKLVVVELKAGSAEDRAIGQIARYMGWVKQNLAGNQEVRGILICADASGGARAACNAIPGLRILRYNLSCTVEPIP